MFCVVVLAARRCSGGDDGGDGGIYRGRERNGCRRVGAVSRERARACLPAVATTNHPTVLGSGEKKIAHFKSTIYFAGPPPADQIGAILCVYFCITFVHCAAVSERNTFKDTFLLIKVSRKCLGHFEFFFNP